MADLADAARLNADLTVRLTAAGDALAAEDLPWDSQLPPSPAPAIPVREISFRQLILGLLGNGFTTAEQALAAVETPARPDAIIATLPADAVLAARVTWATMTEARRGRPLVASLIAAGRATAEQIDELFRQAALL